MCKLIILVIYCCVRYDIIFIRDHNWSRIKTGNPLVDFLGVIKINTSLNYACVLVVVGALGGLPRPLPPTMVAPRCDAPPLPALSPASRPLTRVHAVAAGVDEEDEPLSRGPDPRAFGARIERGILTGSSSETASE